MVGSQWSGKVGCFLVFFMIPSGAGNLHSNPDFQIHTIQRWSHLKTWNQSLVILDIPNFNAMQEALRYSHPLLRYSIFSDGPWLYLQKRSDMSISSEVPDKTYCNRRESSASYLAHVNYPLMQVIHQKWQHDTQRHEKNVLIKQHELMVL